MASRVTSDQGAVELVAELLKARFPGQASELSVLRMGPEWLVEAMVMAPAGTLKLKKLLFLVNQYGFVDEMATAEPKAKAKEGPILSALRKQNEVIDLRASRPQPLASVQERRPRGW